MHDIINSLEKRRRVAAIVVLLLAFVALVFSLNFQLSPPSYFDPKYNSIFTYALIVYKVIELPILYYLLFHRYIVKLRKVPYVIDKYPKLSKHTKLLFFLIPQGNTIFGLIAYKLSGNVLYFLLFSFIALITLFLVKPKKLEFAAISTQA